MPTKLKYQRTAEALKLSILSGSLGDEVVLPSTRKVAEMFGVNHRTAMKAVDELEKEGVVTPLIGKYRRIARPRSPETSPKEIGVIAHGSGERGIHNAILSRFFEAMALEFQKRGVFLKMIIVDPRTSRPRTISDASCDAYICLGDIGENVTADIKEPLFFFNSSYSSPPTAGRFHMDGEKPVFQAVEHLLDKGHRKIGHLHLLESPPYHHYEEQRTAFLNTMRIHGLPSPSGIIDARSRDVNEGLDRFVDQHIDRIQELDALLFCSSFFLPSFLAKLAQRGVSVPDHLSVISLGGPLDCDHFDPPITGFVHDYEFVGRVICKYVLEILSGHIEPVSKYVIDALHFVERASVASPSN